MLPVALLEAWMSRLREVDCSPVAVKRNRSTIIKNLVAAFISLTLLTTPLYATPSTTLGTIVYVDRASVGTAAASVGATVFSGDKLTTEKAGSVQVRAGAARLLLSSASAALLDQDDVGPFATLTNGSATFSTANSKAFALHFGSAVIRPNTDQPTIGQVTVLNPKELVVKSTKGSLLVAVDDDVRVIPEGAGYRIVLDPNAEPPQGPRGAGSKGYGGPPIKAAKSKFMWYAIGVTAVVTFFAVQEALESPDRP
jgi:hypothetical protein